MVAMALTDMPLRELIDYRPDLPEPDDFDEFWRGTIAEHAPTDTAVRLERFDSGLRALDVYDVTFAGYDGAPIKGWLHVPAGTSTPLPTVIQYHGYSGGRGFPFMMNHFAQAGFAQLVMDTRGQSYRVPTPGKATADAHPDALLPHTPGYMTMGIDDPSTHYYRRAYIDALQAIRAARTLDLVDPARIVLQGGSQGGAFTIAGTALAAMDGIDLVAAMPNVPFMCAIPRALDVATTGPYPEVVAHLANWRHTAETAYRTLSYFDNLFLARRTTAGAQFSVGLLDTTCPPSTVYATYNNWPGEKEIIAYSHNGHEGGGPYQIQAEIDLLHEIFG